jgi:hypothetical protein
VANFADTYQKQTSFKFIARLHYCAEYARQQPSEILSPRVNHYLSTQSSGSFSTMPKATDGYGFFVTASEAPDGYGSFGAM